MFDCRPLGAVIAAAQRAAEERAAAAAAKESRLQLQILFGSAPGIQPEAALMRPHLGIRHTALSWS